MNEQYGLIFDVDGVIADTEAVNAAASITVFADLFGLQGVRPEDFELGLGRGAEEYVKSAARVHGLDLTDEQVTAATQARQDTFLSTLAESPIRSFPGVLELINEALEHEQLRVAIATSGTRTKSEAVLRSANIPYTQMAYVTGSDVAHRKPDPELFLTAASRIELPPELCVVIEDAPNGIQAALAAGCKCIAVTNACPRERLEKEAPDMIVDSLIKVTPETILRMASQ